MSLNALSQAIALALVLSLASPSAAQPQATSEHQIPAALSAEEWREDLRFLVAEMEKRHPSLYHEISREAFARAVADLDDRIPRLQRNEIIVGMMRLSAMIGDGHTRIEPRKDKSFAFPSLPLKFYLFEDGLFVRAAAPEYSPLVGARVETIGGIKASEAIRRTAELASRDNAVGPKLFVPLYLAMPDILAALHLSDSRTRAVLTLRKSGRTWKVVVPAGAIDARWPPDTDISLVTPPHWSDARITPAPPMWLQSPLDYHRLIELPDRHALYVQLNMVSDTKEESLDAFDRRIAERVAATNPRTLIIDLRLNQGGNGDLRNGFVNALIRAEDADTRLFVLIARGTFSASQFILNDLDRLTNAIFIGEPASSKPSSYGDSYRSEMPNSHLTVRTSTKWWQDGQDFDPWTWIDVAAPLTLDDYAAGRDPALEAALTYVPHPTLGETLLAAVPKGGTGAALAALRAYCVDPSNRYSDLAGNAARAALFLDSAGEKEAAFAVALASAKSYPDHILIQTVLAVESSRTGHFGLARETAMHVLALDPNNQDVRDLVTGS